MGFNKKTNIDKNSYGYKLNYKTLKKTTTMSKLLLALLTGLFLFSLTACDDDKNSYHPNTIITKAFESKFPHASKAIWKLKKNYSVAKFVNNGCEINAWFDQNGLLYMTKTEYESLDNIPDATVREAFNNSIYNKWKVEDVDYIERLNIEGIYIIEVEQGEKELDLIFTKNGILVKAIPDDNDDEYEDYIPNVKIQTVIELVKIKYPNAQIIETDVEDGFIEIEIIENNIVKEVVYDNTNSWINTNYEVKKTDVEEIVLTTIKNEYKNHKIDDIEKYETPTGTYYVFELEKGEHEFKIKVNLKGEIIR